MNLLYCIIIQTFISTVEKCVLAIDNINTLLLLSSDLKDSNDNHENLSKVDGLYINQVTG